MDTSTNNNSSRHNGCFIIFFLILAFLMGILGSAAGAALFGSAFKNISDITSTSTRKIVIEESGAVIGAVKKVSPAVVSITTSSNAMDFFGRVYEQKGGGTGFIITSDGLIATNKHVVSDENATYQVVTAEGKTYEGKVKAIDPFMDLAILSIDAKGLPVVELGDSDKLQVGQWVIAIGNALAKFDNTVTVGVISARERDVEASGAGIGTEKLESMLQTDAAINPGNSGGPLVNLEGQVTGINTAVAGGAQGIGFAIPINNVKKAIESVQKTGKISRPYLGVRYIPITRDIAKAASLPVDYGAWIYRGSGSLEAPVIPSSPADKAGIKENDIITEINGQRIDEKHSLSSLIRKYNFGDEIVLTVLRAGKEMKVKVMLEEFKQ